jgi:hypothetical protein
MTRHLLLSATLVFTLTLVLSIDHIFRAESARRGSGDGRTNHRVTEITEFGHTESSA